VFVLLNRVGARQASHRRRTDALEHHDHAPLTERPDTSAEQPHLDVTDHQRSSPHGAHSLLDPVLRRNYR